MTSHAGNLSLPLTRGSLPPFFPPTTLSQDKWKRLEVQKFFEAEGLLKLKRKMERIEPEKSSELQKKT
jgi:hypothetical protein